MSSFSTVGHARAATARTRRAAGCSGSSSSWGPITRVRTSRSVDQRAGLVEAHGVDAAECLQGPRGTDQDPTPRQPSGSARLRHRRDQREPLGNSGHGHRDARRDRLLGAAASGAGPARPRRRHPAPWPGSAISRDLGQPCLDPSGRSCPPRGPGGPPRLRRLAGRHDDGVPGPGQHRGGSNVHARALGRPVPRASRRPPWRPGRTRRSASYSSTSRSQAAIRRASAGTTSDDCRAITSPGASRARARS